MEEERRLMYVGVTRAEEYLYLTYAKRRLIYGEHKYFNPSRFLDEIPPKLINFVHQRQTEKRDSIYQTVKKPVQPAEGINPGSYYRATQAYDAPLPNTLSMGKNFRLPDSLRKK